MQGTDETMKEIKGTVEETEQRVEDNEWDRQRYIIFPQVTDGIKPKRRRQIVEE